MGLSPNEMQNILNRARKLCNPSGDAIVSQKSGMLKESIPSTGDFDADAAKWDSLISSAAEDEYREANDIQYNEAVAAKSSLPDAIKKSMLENRIDVGGSQSQRSILETIGIKQDARKQPNSIVESARPTQYASPAIDYSLIKTIVSECVREALEKQPLNENSIRGIQLKKGTISLLDNSGNVYRAKLELVKSGDDKQKTEA